jgi:hypothetical protein
MGGPANTATTANRLAWTIVRLPLVRSCAGCLPGGADGCQRHTGSESPELSALLIMRSFATTSD